MEQQEIYTAQEAADFLKMSITTLKQLIYSQQIGYFRTNGRRGNIRITQEAIEDFIEKNSQSQQQVEVKAEKKARLLLSDANSIKLIDRNASWRSYPVDPDSKQVKKAKWHKLDWEACKTKGELSDLIDAHLEKIEKKKEGKMTV